MYKQRKHIILLILLIGIVFIVPGFGLAQDGTTNESLKDRAESLTIIAKLLSRLWIPVANLAGKIMTNSLVTGEAFKITGFLFQIRSICRVIANFIIVGAVLTMVYNIASSGKGAAPSEMGGKIIRLVVTSLLVNSSWFLLTAVIDLSNLAVVGVSNIGLQIMQSPVLKGAVERQMVCMPNKIKYNWDNKLDPNTIPNCIVATDTTTDYVQQIVPTRQDMSGPLMYFGMGVFKTYEYLDVNTTNSTSSTNGTYDAGSITISFLLKIFLMVMFYTPLVALLIVNFVRMLLIWVWFATGPIIALKLGGLDKDVSWLKTIMDFGNTKPMFSKQYNGEDHFDGKNIIGAIFTPVTVIGTMFFAIIAIASIFSALSGGAGSSTNYDAAQIAASSQALQQKFSEDFSVSTDGHTISAGGSSFQLEGNFVKDTSQYIGGAIGYLIICIMTVGLLWAVFRVGLSTSKLLSGLGKRVMDSGKSAITQFIRLPVGVNGKMVSLDALDKQAFNLDKLGGYFKDNYIDPIKTANLRKLKSRVEQSDRGQKLGFEKTYDGNISFDTRNKKFNKEVFDKKNLGNDQAVKEFAYYSEDFFRKVRADIDDLTKGGGVVRADNYRFKSMISNWLTNGGADYLESKKVITREDYYTKDADDKEQLDIEKLFTTGKALGGFITRALDSKTQEGFKGTGPDDSKFDSTLGDVAAKFKDDKGKEYAKIEIKAKPKS